MGKFKESYTDSIDEDWDRVMSEPDVTDLQRSIALGFAGEMTRQLEYFFDRMKYHDERITTDNIEHLLQISKDIEGTLE